MIAIDLKHRNAPVAIDVFKEFWRSSLALQDIVLPRFQRNFEQRGSEFDLVAIAAAGVFVECIMLSHALLLAQSCQCGRLLPSARAQPQLQPTEIPDPSPVAVHASEAIRWMIIEKLGKGLTIYQGKTGFGKQGKNPDTMNIIYCVITRLEISKFQQEILKIDPTAFIVISSVRELKGGMIKKRQFHET